MILKGFLGSILLLGLASASAQEESSPEAISTPHAAAEEAVPLSDISQLTLEELLNLKVTSAGKKEQHLFDTPAAVFVITAEDIRRSGARQIPDLFRMVPGMFVGRLGSGTYSVASRGFQDVLSNKMLVMVDGRSVYNEWFGGVFWDWVDVVLEDIERIEVIRGPGGALWGANAVNGIINVITKKAIDTQGALVTTGYGLEEHFFGTVRAGGKVGDDARFRVWTKYMSFDDSNDPAGTSRLDTFNSLRGGFRYDRELTSRDTLMFKGDLFRSDLGSSRSFVQLDSPTLYRTDTAGNITTGGFAQAKWERRLSETSDLVSGFYYDLTDFQAPGFLFAKAQVLDFDFQHRFNAFERHDLLWGVDYRITFMDSRSPFPEGVVFADPERTLHLVSGFVQDDITLVRDRLHLIAGFKFLRNEFSGFAFQPSGRLSWTPSKPHQVWAAVSRSVRTPTRIEEDIRFTYQASPADPPDLPAPLAVTITGNPALRPETLLATEAGYRFAPFEKAWFDAAGFYNFYDDLRTLDAGTPGFSTNPVPHVAVPATFHNFASGISWGFELAATYSPTSFWTLGAGYGFVDLDVDLNPASTDTASAARLQNRDPEHQVNFRSYLDLPWNLSFNTFLNYVGAIDDFGLGDYVRLDLKLAWKPTKALELSAVGTNLIQETKEATDTVFETPQMVNPRSVYGKLLVEF